VFLSITWCKFQEFKLHGFQEIEFFLGGCFFMPHPVCVEVWQTSATAEIRRGKKERRRKKETIGQKYNGLPYSIGRP